MPSVEASTIPPGDRGRLIVRDKVAERVAEHAALHSPNIHAYATGLDTLTGRKLPRVRVVIAGNRVRAHLELAVAWPCALPDVARRVQDNVADALEHYAGLQVDGVDIAITQVARIDTPARSVQ
ncbi:MAG: Asp23/Gls24 family protein [Gordonia sp. (in: high G+C Gram-positive bacteria)]|nr:MAG: Asp23/Gls24 family protein [Gordonia sp. (in: high G+C Gram-positive bacteria)]